MRQDTRTPMYIHHFGFREEPFSTTPDPRFFYSNPGHEEAYANLLYGIRQRKGYISLIGEAGTGKTTLLRRVVGDLEKNIRVAFYYYDTTLTFDELLDFICSSFDLPVVKEGRKLEKIQALDRFLRERLTDGGTGVLIVDEAHHLADEVLENLRLLSNIELNNYKLLQIVLVGQPELEGKLDKTDLRQLKQRIAISCRLGCLKPQAVGAFIQHRLQVAGCERNDLFTREAIQLIARHSEGIPRVINTICDNALSTAYSTSQPAVSATIVEKVVQDLRLQQGTSLQPPQKKRWWFTREQSQPTSVPIQVQTPNHPQTEDTTVIQPESELWRRASGNLPNNLPGIRLDEPQRLWTKSLPWLGTVTVAAGLLLYFGAPLLFSKNEVATHTPASVQMAEARSSSASSPSFPVTRQLPTSSASPKRQANLSVAELNPSVSADTAALPAADLTPPPQPRETPPPVTAVSASPPIPQGSSEQPASAAARLPEEVSPVPPASTDNSGRQGSPAVTPPDIQKVPPTQSASSPNSKEQGQAITVARGDTISELVLKIYGNYSSLALDLIKEANTKIADLDRIFVGQQVWLPTLSRDTLLRQQQDGSYRLILGAFPTPASAEKSAQEARRQGYTANIIQRRVSRTRVLYRVELEKISDLATADQAWRLIAGNNS